MESDESAYLMSNKLDNLAHKDGDIQHSLAKLVDSFSIVLEQYLSNSLWTVVSVYVKYTDNDLCSVKNGKPNRSFREKELGICVLLKRADGYQQRFSSNKSFSSLLSSIFKMIPDLGRTPLPSFLEKPFNHYAFETLTAPCINYEDVYDTEARVRVDGHFEGTSLTFSSLETVKAIKNQSGIIKTEKQIKFRMYIKVVSELGVQSDDGLYSTNYPRIFEKDLIDSSINRLRRRCDSTFGFSECKHGTFPIILAAAASAFLLHEVVGHLLEADNISNGGNILSSRMNQKVTNPNLTIIDDPCVPNGFGSFAVDDEGHLSSPTTLVQNGVIRGLLGSDEFRLSQLDCPYGRNARKAKYDDAPLPRMSNLLVLPGKESELSIINSYKNAIYCEELDAGHINPTSGRFTLRVTNGRKIQSGQIRGKIGPAMLTGTVLEILGKVEHIGNKIESVETICGKAGQDVLVGMSAPTLAISGMLIHPIAIS